MGRRVIDTPYRSLSQVVEAAASRDAASLAIHLRRPRAHYSTGLMHVDVYRADGLSLGRLAWRTGTRASSIDLAVETSTEAIRQFLEPFPS